jgi:hypothetical protein
MRAAVIKNLQCLAVHTGFDVQTADASHALIQQ